MEEIDKALYEVFYGIKMEIGIDKIMKNIRNEHDNFGEQCIS